MELILWRHAEAENGKGIPDLERKLSGTGEKQAEKMAHWLKPRLPNKLKVLVAPARRAKQTAEFLELPYTVERKLGIGADTSDPLSAAHWPDGDGPILLLTHQPAMGRLASLFLGGAEGDMPIKKCGVFWFSTREREHRTQVVLRAAMYPDLC